MATEPTTLTHLPPSEKALRESEMRYRNLFQSMDQGYCIIEMIFDRPGAETAVDYRFIEVNPAFETQAGMRDVTGRRMLEFVPSIEEHWLANYSKVALTGEAVRFSNEYQGLNRWFDVYAFRVGEPEQRRVAVLFSDITARKQAQMATATLAAIVEWSDDAIISKDLNGVITSWNKGAEQLFGYKAHEAIGQPVTMLMPADRVDEEPGILARIRRGEVIEHYETVRRHKDGTLIDISLTVSPVRDKSGRIFGASKIARDITQRKRAEESLRRADKLAATGQLAAAVAHEINNPMQALTNLLALLTYKTSLDKDAHAIANMAEKEVARMAHITKQMLAFHRDSVTPVPVRVTEVIDDVLDLLAVKLKGELRVEREYEFAGSIEAFPGELRQAFLNLLSNAAEAGGSESPIKVRIASSRDWKHSESRGVRVVIADIGPGISAANRKKVFEPFFTTKQEKGTGLGLWVVTEVVQRHGGQVKMRTSTRKRRSGTVFSVFLPLKAPKQSLRIAS
jgi:two-component system, chemotaxis family, CheB/CheR fusion protein